MADFDKEIAKSLEDSEVFKRVVKQLEEAATSKKKVISRDPCTDPKCSCKHFRTMEVPDYKLQLDILEFLTNRGVGRPAQADSGDDGEKITFIRRVNK